MERGNVQALAARMLHAVPNFHDVVQASIVIREPGEEVTN
jgi:hypothetical protein